MEGEGRKPKAVFMAFGTKGDVHPIAVFHSPFCFFIFIFFPDWLLGKCRKVKEISNLSFEFI